MRIRQLVVGAAAASGLLLSSAAGCDFVVDSTTTGTVTTGTNTAPPTTTTTTPPVGTPVTIDGDGGLDVVYDVVDPDDADLSSEVESGVYESDGALSTSEPCEFVQTREVDVPSPIRAEVAVSDASLDEDQPAGEPAAEVVEPDSSGTLTVTLLTGDTFASDGCEDWVKVDDAPTPTTSPTTTSTTA